MTRNSKTSEAPTLRLYALWQSNGPKIGVKLHKEILGDFPNSEAAAQFLQIHNHSSAWPYLYCYLLQPIPEFRGNGNPVTIFDRNGIQIGCYDNERLDCFSGRLPDECRYQPGDILMFKDYGNILRLGVIEELPPTPDFAIQAGEESGRLDEIDDAYRVTYFSRGRWQHDYIHECQLFPPEPPVPDKLPKLQQTIRAGWKKKQKPASFYQKTLFLQWMQENRQLFSHEPYLAEEKQSSFTIRFKGVTKHISCCFTQGGDIMVTVDYRNQFYDIIMEFDLYEEETQEGRYLCSMCRDWPNPNNPPEVIEYEDRAELWIQHSFEKMASYTRDEFTDDAVLGICRYGGSTAAYPCRTSGTSSRG